MDHLYNSAFRVERMQLSVEGGVATMGYAQATDDDPALNDMLRYLRARLDMNFIREGKDVLPAQVAGRAPDRVGVLLTYAYAPLKAGDRLVAIENEKGRIPVPGTFDIKVIPDIAQGFADGHHLEVQVIETGQELTQTNWPGEDAFEDDVP